MVRGFFSAVRHTVIRSSVLVMLGGTMLGCAGTEPAVELRAHARQQTVSGRVVSRTATELVVRDSRRQVHQEVIDPGTWVSEHGRGASVSQLGAGDEVELTFVSVGGREIARGVELVSVRGDSTTLSLR